MVFNTIQHKKTMTQKYVTFMAIFTTKLKNEALNVKCFMSSAKFVEVKF